MTTADLLAQLGFSHYCISTNLTDVTDSMAMQQPEAGNPINRVVGHIIATRRGVFKVFPLTHPWDDAQTKVYNAPWNEADKTRVLPLSRLREIEQETFDQLKTAVQSFTGDWDETWPDSSSDRPQTYGQRVQFFMMHEAYHAGQLGTLRRFVGLPGKI